MVARSSLLRLLGTRRAASSNVTIASSRRALFTFPAQKYYHSSPPWQQDVSSPQSQQRWGNPIAESMKASASPTGNNTAASAHDENRNAAFLGEADSDDGFEADMAVHPEAHRHELNDMAASGLHGQSGEGDEPVDAPRRPQEALDGSYSAYLGEADSNDAHEADREANPDQYRHNISDPSNAAFLGEADSDDAHEADREVNPEAYSHRIEDVGASGLHGGPGEGDENIPRGEKGRRFV